MYMHVIIEMYICLCKSSYINASFGHYTFQIFFFHELHMAEGPKAHIHTFNPMILLGIMYGKYNEFSNTSSKILPVFNFVHWFQNYTL